MKTVLATALISTVAVVCQSAEPASQSGLDFYAQGGIVVGNTAFFASDDGCRRPRIRKPPGFPAVISFDVRSGQKLRTYPFGRTYDSSPFALQKQDGTWLIVAHEHEHARTVAIERDTGQIAWTSKPNQPGFYFFGYSYWRHPDGTRTILQASPTGLHALSAEDGQELWTLAARSAGGVTPCVAQKQGWVFYQSSGKVWKVDASNGHVLASASVPAPNGCVSWNTVLVDDERGTFVATRWHGKPEWDSAIRVYDTDLKLVWEQKGLPSGKKDTLCYAEGMLLTGCGNGWSQKYVGDKWKRLTAYRIEDGSISWECDLSGYEFGCIPNVLYFAGSFYAESQGSPPVTSKLFRIRASDGELLEVLDYDRATTSCAPPLIAHGRLYSGDLWQDRIVVAELSTGDTGDWPGTFGDPQRHHCAAAGLSASIVPMREVTRNEAEPATDASKPRRQRR